MKLYWGPHTCAIGIHILLEEIGKPYETEQVDTRSGGTHKPEFLACNPKGKVPVLLRDDGSVLTEFGAIATWLARTNPQAGLLPHGFEEEARTIELIDYVVGTLHMQGFARMFQPKRFGVAQGGEASGIKDQGRQAIEAGFAIVDRQLQGKLLAGGDRLSISDAALFYVERWTPELHIDLPPAVAAHYLRMQAQPAVQRAMLAEGEEPD